MAALLTVNQNRQHSKNYMANSVDPDQAEKLTVEAAVSTHWKHLIDMLLINTQNRCFHEERSNKKYHTCRFSVEKGVLFDTISFD